MRGASASCSTSRRSASRTRPDSTATTGHAWPTSVGRAKSTSTSAWPRTGGRNNVASSAPQPGRTPSSDPTACRTRPTAYGRSKVQHGKNFAIRRSNLPMPHVLIVDDDANTREALAMLATQEGFTTAAAGSVAEARIQLVRQRPDVMLMDLKLPDGSGIELLEDLEDRASIETILITGHASVESAVEALRLGASDYLTKPVNMQRLRAVLSRVPKSGELRAEIGALRDELRRLGRFGRLVGRSPAMQEVYDKIARVAPTEATVLLLGESGTGKEIVARTIHDLSRRRNQPFLAINCGAISPNLIENEMFGHERGSYTGADRQHKGYFEQANGGTLFLDEISEMPLELQVRLLRVLETGTLMRVGTSRPIETDVRIIAATNRDPRDAVRAGRLRDDLYHRLNVFPLTMAPLRERSEDIELIASYFLEEMNEACGTHKKFAPGAVARMKQHPWPG